VLGFGIYGLWSFKTLSQLKVNGPIYNRILQDKDLVADILPPPEYIIESYLVSLQLMTSPTIDRPALIRRLETLRTEFYHRYEFWINANLSGDSPVVLLEKSHTPAVIFFDIAFAEFLPALDRDDQISLNASMSKMKHAYEQHRNAIDDLVKVANTRVHNDELFANQEVLNSTRLMLAVLVLAMVIFGGIILKISLLLNRQMKRLQLTTSQLHAIFSTVPSGIITVDKLGNIKSFNLAAEQIFCIPSKDIIGTNFNNLVLDKTDNFLSHFFKEGQSDRAERFREIQAKRMTGELFPAHLRMDTMRVNDELYACCVIDDITEIKTLHNQLSQAQKLEAVGQLASGVAHEINTPNQFIGDNLSALMDNFKNIQGFHNELRQSADETMLPIVSHLEDKYDLTYILDDSPKAIFEARQGVDKVAAIVNAMKMFTHIGDTKMMQKVNLHEMLNNVLIICHNHYKYNALIEKDFSPDINIIDCYPNELSQVFLNLIVNASDAIEEKQEGIGIIKITTRRQAETIEILIQDSGAGIDQDIQEKVFNLFFTTKPIGKGTGQGLSLSHTIIVDKHQGKLFFESKAGLGTTFYIQLPAN
jgi:PAS domain S-box-containing protein